MRREQLSLVVAVLCTTCSTGPEPVWFRLVDEFDQSMVQGTPGMSEPERAEWRFDGQGTLAPKDPGETVGWTAFNDVTGLAVRDGHLVGTVGERPILAVTRPDSIEGDDVLWGVEVRMRVSAGKEIGLRANGAAKLTDEVRKNVRDNILKQVRPVLRAELRPGDEFQTYLLREAGQSIPIRAVRNLFLEPTDADGAEFEIESVRIIPLKEHLSTIPSGPGWEGLSEIYRETIVARSPERIVADVKLPDQPWLDLAIGTIEDGPVTFNVHVTAGGREESVLRRTVTTPNRWDAMRIELGQYSGQRVSLSLALEADEPGRLGYWGGPVIRSSGTMPANSEITDDRAALADGGTRRPKAVILFLADALRRDHLSMYGYDRETSPTLQSIGDAGIVFADNIAQGSWTKVSVPSILTSLYPTSHGITDPPDRLPSSVTTLSEAFRHAGYATWQSSSVPFSGKLSNLQQGVDVLHEVGSIGELPHSPAKTARTYVDRFLEWASDHRDVPFFAFVHTFDPHSPFEPYKPYDALWSTEEGKAEFKRGLELWEGPFDDLPTQAQLDSTDINQELFVSQEKGWYDASIRAMDQEIARLLEGLEEMGIRADETLFIFIADHGEEFLEHGFHFHGNSAYGEMMDVPLIMRWSGVLPPGVRITRTTESVDVYPTLLELAGIRPPKEAQGQSLLPLILDPEAGSDFGAIRRAAFSERVKPPSFGEMGLPFDQYSIILDGWKLVKNEKQPASRAEYELYNHTEDPLDLHDVAADHPDIVERLAGELATWRQYAIDLRPPPDSETLQGLSPEEIARLRSLGYINN